MAPLVQAAKLPCFLWTCESASDETMLEDRRMYVASLASQTSEAALFMKRRQEAKDVDYRMVFLGSLTSKGMLKSMAGD